MSNQIVVVLATQTLAGAPSVLQKTGAMITQGGTTTAAGTLTQLSTLTNLVAILAPSVAIATITWADSVATVTTGADHGWGNGDVILVDIAGVVPAGYNGTQVSTITGADTFTFPLTSDPGSETTPGTATLHAVAELLAMGTTFFAQTFNTVPVNVLELGEGITTAGITALGTWITGYPRTVYSYLVPREWDGQSSFITLAGLYTAINAFTYFFVTTTLANMAAYAGLKNVLAAVEASQDSTVTLPPTEFSLAAEWAVTLNYAPSSSNQVPPLSYAFVYGVTAYPLPNNQNVFTELTTANVGWVGTGAEGGLSNTIVFRGKMSDGNPFNYWYAGDYAQLQLDLNLTNEVITGSNAQPPLYYNQPGIDRLQNRGAQTLQNAVTNGLLNGPVITTKLPALTFYNNYISGLYAGQNVLNAEPFLVYSQENPDDYSQGVYGGFSAVVIPQLGFDQIFFNLNITNII